MTFSRPPCPITRDSADISHVHRMNDVAILDQRTNPVPADDPVGQDIDDPVAIEAENASRHDLGNGHGDDGDAIDVGHIAPSSTWTPGAEEHDSDVDNGAECLGCTQVEYPA